MEKHSSSISADSEMNKNAVLNDEIIIDVDALNKHQDDTTTPAENVSNDCFKLNVVYL